jgi:hypothetical protein
MSLAWSTVALLVLLLPGFLFFVGLYLPERISRDIVPGSTLTQLGGVVFVAFFVHALLFGLLFSACGALAWLPCIRLDYALSAFSPDNKGAVPIGDIAANLRDSHWWVLSYISLASALGLGAGLIAGKLVIQGPFRFLAKHNWIYDLIDVDDNAYTLAYVLTNIRDGDRVLMYRGLLQEYFFSPEGKLSYLVLIGCSGYYLRLDPKKPRTSSIDDWLRIGTGRGNKGATSSEMQWSYLVIEGDKVANVVFDRYRVTLTEEGLTALETAAA